MMNKNLNKIRYSILEICAKTKEGHIGSAFSIIEIVYIIFKKFIKKNFFILSKGHASIGIYAIMNNLNLISNSKLNSFCKLNSKLGGHPDSTKIPILNFSTGSLGHGLPTSTGLAYALKLKKDKRKVICLMGDQELMEGTTWESLHAIENYKLSNLIIIIDRNHSDFRSIKFLKLKKKLLVFCKNIFEIDGHDILKINKVIKKCITKKNFSIIIANTIKGYGIKEIENNPAWHHKTPNANEMIKFKNELKI